MKMFDAVENVPLSLARLAFDMTSQQHDEMVDKILGEYGDDKVGVQQR